MIYRHIFCYLVLTISCGPYEKRKAAFDDVFERDDDGTEYKDYYDGLSVQRLRDEYFNEMFIQRGLNSSAPPGVSGGTAKIKKNILIWFDAEKSNDAIEAAKEIIPDAVKKLTNSKIDVIFAMSKTQPEANNRLLVPVVFSESMTAPGEATFVEDSTGEITQAKIWIRSNLSVIKNISDLIAFRVVIRHELGHILAGTYHSAMTSNIMTYNRTVGTAYNYQDYEVQAFQMLYDIEAGTKFAELQSSGKIMAEHLDVSPRIVSVNNVTDPTQSKNIGKVGDQMSISGERFNFKWGCSDYTFDWPVVTLNGTTIGVVMFNRSAGSEGGSANCAILNFIIPAGAKSGAITVTAYGKTSNAIQFTVK